MIRRSSVLGLATSALIAAIAALAAVAPACHAAVLGQWRFAEPSGQRALDDGPFGLDGRLGGAAAVDNGDPLRIGGVADGALRFADGAFVRLPNQPQLDPVHVSVEAVVRADASPGRYRYIVSRGGWKCFAGAFGLYTGSGGGAAFYVFDGKQYAISPAARTGDLWDGQWHHVAGVFDGNAVSLYVDGRQVGEPTLRPMTIDYIKASPAMAFGVYVGSCELPYSGDLDLIRLSDTALSPQDIAAASTAALRRPGSVGPLPSDPAPPFVSGPVPAGPGPVTVPGAPEPACRMKISPGRVRAARRTTLRVRVRVRGEPAAGIRVRASRRGRALARSRTGASGKARLRLRAPKRGRLRVTAVSRPKCRPGVVGIRR